MAGQVGGQQVSREELRARGRYSMTIACLFLLILLGAGLALPRRAIVVVPIVVAIVVSIREMRRRVEDVHLTRRRLHEEVVDERAVPADRLGPDTGRRRHEVSRPDPRDQP
jgi:hypothetical protein